MWSPSAAATAASLRSSLSSVRALLVDLSGTVHVEDEAIPGAVDAVQKLKEKKFPVKFVTNTTKARVLFDWKNTIRIILYVLLRNLRDGCTNV